MRATILIVDDNSRLRALIRRISTQEPGLQVVGEAKDGLEAIQLANLLHPDIVLMDLVMPRMNGLEAMLQIKVECPATKVIIMTVHNEDVYQRTAEASGADAFLLKKTLMTALLPTIRRIRCPMSAPTLP